MIFPTFPPLFPREENSFLFAPSISPRRYKPAQLSPPSQPVTLKPLAEITGVEGSEEIKNFEHYALLISTVWLLGSFLEKRVCSGSQRYIHMGTSLFIFCARFTHRLCWTKWGRLLPLFPFLLFLLFSSPTLLTYGAISVENGGSEGVIYLVQNPLVDICYPFLLYILLILPCLLGMILAATPSIKQNLQRLHGEDILKQLGYNCPHRTAEEINKVIRPYILAVFLLMLTSMCLSTYLYVWAEMEEKLKLKAAAMKQGVLVSQAIDMGIKVEPTDTPEEVVKKLEVALEAKEKSVEIVQHLLRKRGG